MKDTIYRHCCAALCALILSGCGMMGDPGAVKDPTVDQMADLEKQWGLKPRETRQRFSPNADPSTSAPSPTLSPQPPAMNPVPSPATPATPTQTIPLPLSEAPSIPSSLR